MVSNTPRALQGHEEAVTATSGFQYEARGCSAPQRNSPLKYYIAAIPLANRVAFQGLFSTKMLPYSTSDLSSSNEDTYLASNLIFQAKLSSGLF